MNQAFKEAFERNYVIMNKWKYTCINKHESVVSRSVFIILCFDNG